MKDISAKSEAYNTYHYRSQGEGDVSEIYGSAFFYVFTIDMVQFDLVTFPTNVKGTFWHPKEITEPIGDQAKGRQS